MEPSWNENSIEQIIGRGVRYKSHVNLPKYKQNVIIYKLYCIKPEEYNSKCDNLKKKTLVFFFIE